MTATALWVVLIGLVVAGRAQDQATQPAGEPGEPPTTTQAATQLTDLGETLPTDLTPENVQRRIAAVEAAADLADTVKAELLGLYKQALDQLSLAADWDTKVAEYQKGREDAPQLLEAARQALAQAASRPTTEPVLEIAPDESLDQLNQKLAEVEADLKTKQEVATKLDLEAKTRSDRTAAIPDLLADANTRLQKIVKDVSAPPAAGLSPQVTLARRTLFSTQKRAVEQEIEAYEGELRFYNARSELLATRRDKTRLEVAEAQAQAEAWQAAVSERRQAEVERQQRQAEEELAAAPPAVQELAETNKQLVEERARLVRQIDGGKEAARVVKEHSETLSRDFRYLQDNADRAALADLIGPLMRKQRGKLNSLRYYDRDFLEIKQKFERVQVRIPQIEEQRLALADIEAEVAAVLRKLRESRASVRPERLEPTIRELFASRRESLESLQKDYETYANDLIQLIAAESGLLAKIHEFEAFIQQRVLWVRSTGPLPAARILETWRSLGPRMVGLARALAADAGSHLSLYGLTILVLLSLLASQARLRLALRRIRERVSKVHTDSYRLTLAALLYTVLLALPGAYALGFVGWRTPLAAEVETAEVYELARAVGAGLGAAGVLLLTLSLIRQVCRSNGLAVVHFRWEADRVQLVRRHLVWLTAVVVPARFLVVASEDLPEDAWRDSVGRVALMVGMIALAVCAQRLLRPEGGILTHWLRRGPTSWAFRLRYVWYLLAVATPLSVVGASAAGYHYSAVQITARLLPTFWLVLGLLLLHALLLRAVLVAQRRLAIETARKKRAALAEARAGEPGAGGETPPIEESALSLVTIGDQTRRLLRSLVGFCLVIGLWLTWADMLPALSFMHEVRLWPYKVETVTAGGEAGAAGSAVPQVQYITLAHVVLALIVGLVTFVLARNIPGLLEITLLQKLPIDTGGRFAVTTIARYIIIVIGVVVVFGSIGVGWSNVQWLVAAISVGLGFGLQEIFANFVSGLILLFERPIRIGDTVTVGNISGTVTRIRIRATTITDWDRKELIIPNKEFITGQVVNWTLSDPTLRLVVPVGIAYGSDTDLAEELLLKVAREDPNVLEEPEPKVFFMGFGESALNFELRVYVGSVDHLLRTRHQLHKAIDREFRQAKIEIAFPQRDIHLRSLPAGLPTIDVPAAQTADPSPEQPDV